jgi:hypothetical protein
VDAISFIEKENNTMTDKKINKRAVKMGSHLNKDEEGAAPKGGEPTLEIKPALKKPSAIKGNDQEPLIMEDDVPDLTEQIRRFAEAELPSCPHCGSHDTASVQVGMVGRAIAIAAATTKIKLVPNAKDKLGLYFCNECGKFFN